MILVIGADGKIGHALTSRLVKAGRQVVTTTRRRENISESTLYLDLSENLQDWDIPKNIQSVAICAGVSSVGACAADPEDSSRINVQGTFQAARKLVESGAFVIFLSSGHVFSGDTSHQRASLPYSPVTEYGRQKAEAERLLGNLGDGVAVVRLSNVIGPADPLISGWTDAFKNREVITPFKDMTFAPVPLSSVTSCLQLILDARMSGIWQISGDRDVSYAVAARVGARLLGADDGLIQPVLASESGYNERIRVNTTLDISRLQMELGVQPPSVDWTLKMAFTNPLVLGQGTPEL